MTNWRLNPKPKPKSWLQCIKLVGVFEGSLLRWLEKPQGNQTVQYFPLPEWMGQKQSKLFVWPLKWQPNPKSFKSSNSGSETISHIPRQPSAGRVLAGKKRSTSEPIGSIETENGAESQSRIGTADWARASRGFRLTLLGSIFSLSPGYPKKTKNRFPVVVDPL